MVAPDVAGITALYALADPALLEYISSLVEVITEVSLGYSRTQEDFLRRRSP
jgi:hypothetical protein